MWHNLRGHTKQSVQSNEASRFNRLARVLPLPDASGRRSGRGFAHVGVIVEVMVVSNTRPIWWRAVEAPPPDIWLDTFEDFTGEDTADQWGLGAAIFIAQTRRRTGSGPTFSEMFKAILIDTDGVPSRLPETIEPVPRRKLIGDFRICVAIDWKRRGWVSWNPNVPRSLRVGRAFRELSHLHKSSRDSQCPDGTGTGIGKALPTDVDTTANPHR